MRLDALDQLARRQFGLVRFDQSGLTRSAWTRALRAGTFVRVGPNVVRLVGTETDERQRIKAAVLSMPGTIASHRSAAVLWEFVASDADPGAISTHAPAVHLTHLEPTRTSDRPGIVLHRPDDRLDVRPVTRQTIPCTPPLRTLLDLGITHPAEVHAAVGAALEQGLLTLDALEAGLRRHARRGRHGVVALRSAIDRWAVDHRPADSILELAFGALVAGSDLPPVTFHERVGRWELDFRFVGTPIVVECDGWGTHGRDRRRFEQDRRKDADLHAAGWIVVRLSYRSITQRRGDTVRRLRAVLDRWSGTPAPDAQPISSS